MTTMRRAAPLAAALVLAACVSLEEAPLPKGAIRPGQRTVLLVYSPPGPAFTEEDTKAESAAKVLPGLGLLVQSVQNDKSLALSKGLQQYLPAWNAAEVFTPLLNYSLALSGHPGRFVSAEEAPISTDTLKRLNRADNAVDWLQRYYYEDPERPVPRNYSAFLSLDDALIFEVNLVYGVTIDGSGNAIPTLGALTKLYRANTMRTLWRHEDSVDDQANPNILYEYKLHPVDLINKYERLMSGLAQKITESYRANLVAAGLFRNPVFSVQPQAYDLPPVATSTATAVSPSTTTAH